jgi:hypothetical protein
VSLDSDDKARWTTALRSGTYQQGTHYLRSGDRFCCLGVACDVFDPEGWSQEPPAGVPLFDTGNDVWWHHGVGGVPTGDVRDRLGLGTSAFTGRLIEMNDNGASFAVIADFIDAYM